MKNILIGVCIFIAMLFVTQANALSQVYKGDDSDIICTMEYAPVCGEPVFYCPDGAICMKSLPVTY
jgi:hypothetical protein